MIDKDFTQHKVVITGFPQAKIFFCQFHVIKYLCKKVSHCDIPKDDRKELQRKLKSLVYAASETEYDELKNEIAVIANSEFLQYFTTNWETCKSMWASYLRDQYLHLANTTK